MIKIRYVSDFLKLIFNISPKLVMTDVDVEMRLFCSQTIKYAKEKTQSIEPTDRTTSSF